jgi:diguanylate cyclase (GGDEF)-like protein
MSDINLVEPKKLIAQIDQLKLQLTLVKLTQRDAAFKHTRESKVLKRVLTKLSDACLGHSDDLDKAVSSLKSSFQQQQDVSKLIPQLAELERLLRKNSVMMDKNNTHLDELDENVRLSGETLQRIPGLPAQLKRDLRNLLSFPSARKSSPLDQATRLLAIYERAIKIITSNSANSLLQDDLSSNELNKELLDKLAEELQHLISELDFGGNSGDLLSDIRIKLLSGVDHEQLTELTLQILKIVVEGTQFERKTSEQFLTEVNTSLAKVNTATKQTLKQSQSYSEHRKQMSQEISDTVQESQSALAKVDDIDSAKAALNPLLQKIAMLTERLQHNEQREATALERIQQTNQQIEGLYEYTQDYRRRFEDQAKRLLLDPLTKIYNRNAFLERFEFEYHRWLRSQHNVKVVLIDIDNFKILNENFGYSAGDKALKIITRSITKELDDDVTVARFSGEEFILLLSDVKDDASLELISRIQTQIPKLPFKFRDQHISITVSVAATQLNEADTPETLLDRLNVLLSEAKTQGTGQLIVN